MRSRSFLPNFPISHCRDRLWKLGAVVFPLNHLYPTGTADSARDSGVETAIALTRFYVPLCAIQPTTGLKRIIATNIKEYLPRTLRVLFTLFRERKEGHRIILRPSDFWFQDLLARHRGAERPASAPGPDDPAIMLMSGGTTGTPKRVVGHHRSLVAAGLQLHAWMRPGSRDWEDVILLPLPLFHVYANVGVQTYAIVGHNPMLLVPNPRRHQRVLPGADSEGAAGVSSCKFPDLFTSRSSEPRMWSAGKADSVRIRDLLFGAAPLMAETKRRSKRTHGRPESSKVTPDGSHDGNLCESRGK